VAFDRFAASLAGGCEVRQAGALASSDRLDLTLGMADSSVSALQEAFVPGDLSEQ
jgi:hypothetical protein